MHPIVSVIDTGAALNLSLTNVWDFSLLESICKRKMPDNCYASYAKLKMSGTITVYLHMGESRTLINFGFVTKLV